MFTDTKVFSAYAVDDLAQARKFYGETLGVRAPSSTDTSGGSPGAAARSSPPGSRTQPETSLRCCRSGSASSA